MTPAEAKKMQANLGFIGGDVDGRPGRATYTQLFRLMGATAAGAAALGLSASVNFPRYGIDDSPTRLIHFMGQCAHESGGFRLMREIWGPTKQQAGYEGRKDLGNTRPGDGILFLGRSPGMVTGRGNYRRVSTRMGIDVEAEPQLLERFDLGLWAFCIWWDENKANRVADLNDVAKISRLINRGNANAERPANHEAERGVLTLKARKLIV